MNIHITTTLIFIFSNLIMAQEPIRDIRLSQSNNEIIISYNLNKTYSQEWKEYPKTYFNIIRNYDISLLYSINNGKSFIEITDASGDIGNNIFIGKREIRWQRDILIGKYYFKLKATPRYYKQSFGLAYTTIKWSENYKLNNLKFFMNGPSKRGLFIALDIGILEEYFRLPSDKHWTQLCIIPSIGLNIEENIAFYFGIGPCFGEGYLIADLYLGTMLRIPFNKNVSIVTSLEGHGEAMSEFFTFGVGVQFDILK